MTNTLFDEAMIHLRSPLQAKKQVQLIIDHLALIKGFDELPDSLRQAIERRAAELYGVGFVRGANWNERGRTQAQAGQGDQ